jgi:hypothetical protein
MSFQGIESAAIERLQSIGHAGWHAMKPDIQWQNLEIQAP